VPTAALANKSRTTSAAAEVITRNLRRVIILWDVLRTVEFRVGILYTSSRVRYKTNALDDGECSGIRMLGSTLKSHLSSLRDSLLDNRLQILSLQI